MAKKYWFNTKTQRVEHGRKSLAVYRLGPFETEQEAKNAEQTISERGRKLIEEDQLKDSSEDGNSRD